MDFSRTIVTKNSFLTREICMQYSILDNYKQNNTSLKEIICKYIKKKILKQACLQTDGCFKVIC